MFTIAVFLDWISVDNENNDSFSGYETDSLIPFVAFLGIGFAAALLYAVSRAYRRQHRGLTLSCMAAGIAATLLALAYIIDPPGASERGDDLSTSQTRRPGAGSNHWDPAPVTRPQPTR